MIDSVEAAAKWPGNFPSPDLIFMDIQLADGLSFDVFSKAEVTAPLIFTTAFDPYTLRVFKVNSIDCLLKPTDPDELNLAVEKYRRFLRKDNGLRFFRIGKIVIKDGQADRLQTMLSREIWPAIDLCPSLQSSLLFSEDGVTFLKSTEGKNVS